jgi:hypothetical protein
MTISLSSRERFEFGLSELEKGLNVAAVFPGLNIFTGGLRSVIGKIQCIAGLAIGCFSLLAAEFAKNAETRAKFQASADFAFEHVKHGIANFVRGIFEASSTLCYLGGAAIWLCYDMQHYRLQYPGEIEANKHLTPSEYSISSLAKVAKEISQDLVSMFYQNKPATTT